MFFEEEVNLIFYATTDEEIADTRSDFVKLNHHLDEFRLVITVVNFFIRMIKKDMGT